MFLQHILLTSQKSFEIWYRTIAMTGFPLHTFDYSVESWKAFTSKKFFLCTFLCSLHSFSRCLVLANQLCELTFSLIVCQWSASFLVFIPFSPKLRTVLLVWYPFSFTYNFYTYSIVYNCYKLIVFTYNVNELYGQKQRKVKKVNMFYNIYRFFKSDHY